jgi:hypothetical protein
VPYHSRDSIPCLPLTRWNFGREAGGIASSFASMVLFSLKFPWPFCLGLRGMECSRLFSVEIYQGLDSDLRRICFHFTSLVLLVLHGNIPSFCVLFARVGPANILTGCAHSSRCFPCLAPSYSA